MSREMNFDLKEIELVFGVLDEGLSCLLHTILFLRARQAVNPRDIECKRLKPLTYPRIDNDDVEAKVNSAVKNFRASLMRVGTSKGILCVKFYLKSIRQNWLYQQVEEKIVFEKWSIPIGVRQERLAGTASVESVDSESAFVEYSLDQVQRSLMQIFTV